MRRTYRVRRQTGLNKKSLFPLWRSVPSLCNSVKQLITQSTTEKVQRNTEFLDSLISLIPKPIFFLYLFAILFIRMVFVHVRIIIFFHNI